MENLHFTEFLSSQSTQDKQRIALLALASVFGTGKVKSESTKSLANEYQDFLHYGENLRFNFDAQSQDEEAMPGEED